MPVIWNLSYPIITPDQMATFRHHFEVLRQDSHVASVESTERTDTPFVMTMRVTFANGFDRPDSQELRHADALFPSQTTHFERDIQVLPQGSTPEQAQEALRRLQFELPNIRGMSRGDVVERMREVMDALRSGDPVNLLHHVGQGIDGFTEPEKLPKWLTVGRVCHARGSTTSPNIVTVKHVIFAPEAIHVAVHSDQGRDLSYPLKDFVIMFEPYERPMRLLTAWEKVLENSEDDE